MDFEKESKDIQTDIDRISSNLNDHIENQLDYPLKQLFRDLESAATRVEKADASLMKSAKELAGLRTEIKTLQQTVKGLTGEEW
jgi:predicted  nucleic acid-binding Zn-ribbon protein